QVARHLLEERAVAIMRVLPMRGEQRAGPHFAHYILIQNAPGTPGLMLAIHKAMGEPGFSCAGMAENEKGDNIVLRVVGHLYPQCKAGRRVGTFPITISVWRTFAACSSDRRNNGTRRSRCMLACLERIGGRSERDVGGQPEGAARVRDGAFGGATRLNIRATANRGTVCIGIRLALQEVLIEQVVYGGVQRQVLRGAVLAAQIEHGVSVQVAQGLVGPQFISSIGGRIAVETPAFTPVFALQPEAVALAGVPAQRGI